MTPEQAAGALQAPPGGSRQVACSLCPVTGGAFRQTVEGSEWVHQVASYNQAPVWLSLPQRSTTRMLSAKTMSTVRLCVQSASSLLPACALKTQSLQPSCNATAAGDEQS